MIDVAAQKSKGFIPMHISREQAKDTGMAMVLICLLVAFVGQIQQMAALAVPLLLLNMIWPGAYKPVAKLWLGFSHLMGTIMAKLILSFLFFVLVTPVGLLRRMLGRDTLQLKKWKKDQSSVFRVREHAYTSEDINKPF